MNALAPALARALLAAGLLAAPLPAPAFATDAAPAVAQVLGADLRVKDADQARYAILRRLLDRYASDQGLTASAAEIDAYVARMRSAEARDREQWQARLREIDALLATSTPAAAERERLSGERRMLSALLANDPAQASPTRAAVEDATARQAATVAIRRWKASVALHARHGGPVAVTPAGPEPLAAHRRFLEDEQRKGTWKLADPALERAFWAHFDPAAHRVLPAGSDEERAALAAPW